MAHEFNNIPREVTTSEPMIEQKRGRGRPPKYATDEERKAARAQKRVDYDRRYNETHQSEIQEKKHQYYLNHIPEWQQYYVDKLGRRQATVSVPTAIPFGDE